MNQTKNIRASMGIYCYNVDLYFHENRLIHNLIKGYLLSLEPLTAQM